MNRSHHLDPRSSEELIEAAERYERWAARTDWNPEVSATFRRLAMEARAKLGIAG